MKYLKNLIMCLGSVIAIILVFGFIMTIMSFFNIINDSVTNVFKILIPIISILTGGIIMGKNSSKKGWLEGLKLGLMVCLLLFLFNILGLQNSIKLSTFLFYSILTITSIVGSMIGISFGEKK